MQVSFVAADLAALMSDTFSVTSRDDMVRVIAACQAAGVTWRIPLLRAVMQKRIALVELRRETPAPIRDMERMNRPVVVLLGDDDGMVTGPAGWASVGRLQYWPRAVMIHAAGGTAEHYQDAVAAAEVTGRCLIVETTSGKAESWAAWIKKAPQRPHVLMVLPRNGLHPVAPSREGVQ